jgi:saccharopine dehydrogenase (NAD+, L-lysine-forming)
MYIKYDDRWNKEDNLDKLNSHTHIYFSHTYKNQTGSQYILDLFLKSNSILYDLEYFLNQAGKRIIAFGFFAGFVGVGLGILQYLKKLKNQKISKLKYWTSSKEIINEINETNGNSLDFNLKVCIIGSDGRCGQGAQFLLNILNCPYVTLGPSDEKNNLEKFDIVVNCICLTKQIGTWFDSNTKFSNPLVIVDISCDYNNSFNPIKIYNNKTTWEVPIFSYNELVDIIAIDNLPSLLPLESSSEFSTKLVELILQSSTDPYECWANNLETFKNKIKHI